ncbi:Phospho-N-acetylmuramoyl-pentapeptide-transferas e [Candidatus Westeberhardia cardiocondylae]|uniref:Phospho-N-acetylmuramoyl-pentapeptide-transferase n=1 Tax=Candidatus Westeberhardia cardiocondylae TaxID=1594731 RepID=A0A0H5BWR9_9ENTR|nr:phospho-N-acetylmuramoyl-pentapeptide-transferase [Candidatus Westeberhardia cardiocondylae]CEN32113.1 Phospho-N-acetylmuramoyl-pentapeptide-transferas e [Candidatus Westeberhardia cardiocondylae]
MFKCLIENFLIQNQIKINTFFCFRIYEIIASAVTSFLLSTWIGYILIKKLRKLQINQIIRKNGPKSHLKKQGTPTMGGLIIIFSIIISTFLWIYPFNSYIFCILFSLIGYGIIGFIDDYKKISNNNTDGLNFIWKYFLQSIITLLIIHNIFMLLKEKETIQLILPFVKKNIPFSSSENMWWYIILCYVIIIGISNAVNLTDGLDGLAIIPIILVSLGLGIISWKSSNIKYTETTLHIPYLTFSYEITIICAIIIGSALGFLLFNIYPAKIFMGDVGSLSLGSILSTIAILLHQELFLLIISGIFIIEVISVIIQFVFFKIKKRRIFLMAPIHHHYELKGIPEKTIVIRFWIISAILTYIGILSI